MYYSFGLGFSFWSMASATLRRWILPVAVLGISLRIQICCGDYVRKLLADLGCTPSGTKWYLPSWEP